VADNLQLVELLGDLMKLFNTLILMAVLCAGTVASAQLSTSALNATGLERTGATFGNFVAKDGFFVGKNQWSPFSYYYDFTSLVNELGCFPTGDQVPLATLTRESGNTNQQYRYAANFSGTLAPGQALVVHVNTCNSGGEQPYIQSEVFYEYVRKTLSLTHTVIAPDGTVHRGGDGQTGTTTYKYSPAGVYGGLGRPGVWTVVLKNETRHSIEVYSASTRVFIN